uniref:DUF202 domain-containing protein n=1 Tax=Entomoneis paludosa TaxID=265537 RepID=A0A7S2YGL1_9STRA
MATLLRRPPRFILPSIAAARCASRTSGPRGTARGQQRRFLSLWRNEEVDNSGSVARDILAIERTFLAWARTGLGFVGAGSGLAAAYHQQKAELAPTVLPASALLIGNGAFLLLFATRRYYAVISALKRNKFPINAFDTLGAIVITSINTIAALGIVWYVEMSHLNEQETDMSETSDSQSGRPTLKR